MCVCVRERDRQRERERDRDRDTETETETQRDLAGYYARGCVLCANVIDDFCHWRFDPNFSQELVQAIHFTKAETSVT